MINHYKTKLIIYNTQYVQIYSKRQKSCNIVFPNYCNITLKKNSISI